MSTKLLKIISLFLTLVLLCNMLPPNVFANEISKNTPEQQVEATSQVMSEPEVVEEVIGSLGQGDGSLVPFLLTNFKLYCTIVIGDDYGETG